MWASDSTSQCTHRMLALAGEGLAYWTTILVSAVCIFKCNSHYPNVIRCTQENDISLGGAKVSFVDLNFKCKKIPQFTWWVTLIFFTEAMQVHSKTQVYYLRKLNNPWMFLWNDRQVCFHCGFLKKKRVFFPNSVKNVTLKS